MKKQKKLLSILLSVVLCLSLLPLPAFAADIASGAGWNLDSDGCLHLTGAITNPSTESTAAAPWIDHLDKITSVIAEEGASVDNCARLFYACYNMTSADLSKLDTTGTESMQFMFYNCPRLSSLDISSFDTSAVKNMYGMFYECNALTELDVTHFDTSEVVNMGSMFYGCMNLTELDVSSFDTTDVWSMESMFQGCQKLASLDLSTFNTSNVSYMARMFSACYSLETMDLSTFDTAKAEDMDQLFYQCSSLETVNFNGFDTSASRGMDQMFYGCVALKTLDLSGFDVTSVSYISEMLNYCNNLAELKLNPAILGKIASNVSSLSAWKDPETGTIYERYYSSDALKEITTNVTLLKLIAMGDGWYLDGYGCLHITGAVTNYSNDEIGDYTPWNSYKSQITSVVAEPGSSIDNGAYLFYNCTDITEIDLSELDTSAVTDMGYMFGYCTNLTELDLSEFDTSSVTNMAYMFEGCTVLPELDVSSFDTSKVTDMCGMFYSCFELTELDVSSFDTSNVTSMAQMFMTCIALQDVDLSNFNTAKVENMYGMFSYCKALTELDLSSFNTANVQDMSYMFEYAEKLTKLDLSSFDTSHLQTTRQMFQNCTGLAALDLSSFSIGWDMVKELLPEESWDLAYGYIFDSIFYNCSGIKTVSVNEELLIGTAEQLLNIAPEWANKADGTTYSTADELKAITGTATLIRGYNTITVETDGNGTAEADAAVAMPGETVTLTATPGEGFHFKEWQSDEVTVDDDDTFTMPAEDVTVTAIFEEDVLPAEYTVTFDLNGHGTAIAAQTVTEGEQAAEPAAPSAEGWTFGGWYSDAACTTEFDFTAAITGDTTVYAKWTEAITEPEEPEQPPVEPEQPEEPPVEPEQPEEPPVEPEQPEEPPVPVTYTVTFDLNGHGKEIAAQTVNEGSTATRPADPKESGYTFGGWFTDAGCTAKYDFSSPLTADVTLYAKWTKNSSGGGSGGSGSSSPKTYASTVLTSSHGTVTANTKTAAPGETVKLTVTPEQGYTLETITVKAQNGRTVPVTGENNAFTFIMPAGPVEISATFMEDNTILNYFVDVPLDAYYYNAVLWAAENGITSGTDALHFSPNSPCTRAQVVTFLWRAAGCPVADGASVSGGNPFADVARSDYYYDAVLWAVANGITNGTTGSTFSPNAVCSRGQIAAFLWRSEGSPALLNMTADGPAAGSNPFADITGADYFFNPVLWAVSRGITNGTTASTFSPNADCTRAQIVTFLYRSMGN